MSHVCVVGLGKIGLPLAVQIAGSGREVIGLDVSAQVVEMVNAGTPPFPGEPGLETGLSDARETRRIRATTDAGDAVPAAEAVIVVVPLLVDTEFAPDFGMLDAATDAVGSHLTAGTLVSYETTLPVGGTRRLAAHLAERSGLTLGTDLFVCHSPERVSSGSVFRDLRAYPKLVGGIDPESTRRAAAFYSDVLEFDDRPDLARANGVWALSHVESAELAKLAETTYRDINIAFANELALASERIGADALEVIAACNSQPHSHIHRPGVAVGGHCIPVYPHLLMGSVPGFRLPAVAREVNGAIPDHAVAALADVLGSLDGLRVVVLGLAYRGGVKEDAVSGAFALVAALERRGAVPVVHDPLYSAEELEERGLVPYEFGEPCDAAIVQADHAAYAQLEPTSLPGVRAVYDGRHMLASATWRPIPVLRLGHAPPDRTDA